MLKIHFSKKQHKKEGIENKTNFIFEKKIQNIYFQVVF